MSERVVNRNGTAAILRQLNRKVVVLEHATKAARSAGLIGEEDQVQVVLGRPDQLQAAKQGALIAAIGRRKAERDGGEAEETEGITQTDDEATRLLLQVTMINPCFWSGAAQDAPEGYVTIHELGADLVALLAAVESLLGVSPEDSKKSGGVRAELGPDAGRDRTEIPGAADSDPGAGPLPAGRAAGHLPGGDAA